MDTIKIRGIAYVVLERHTPEDMLAQNCPALAQNMKQRGIAEELYLRRPKGKRQYFAIRGTDGQYSTPERL